jgi:hypothetical protein
MFLIAQHFGRMGAMVKEKIPYNQEIFARNAPCWLRRCHVFPGRRPWCRAPTPVIPH